jgi:hypothetical protein
MERIMLAASWDGSPKSLTSPENPWVRFLEVRGIAYAAYLDEPSGWRLVICDQVRFERALPALKKYGVFGVCEWRYDLHS